MPSFKALILGSALFVQCLYTATAIPRQRSEEPREAQRDAQAFQKLLDQVDPTALHSALHQHSPTPFRDGIFKEDRTAAEALHRENPPLATSIVALARRQAPGSNSTVVVITSINTVTAVDTTVTQSISPTSGPPNSVQSTGQSTVPATQSALPTPPSSSNPVVVGPSSTLPGGTVVVGGTTTVGGSTVTQPGGPIITSAPNPSTFSSGQIITTTNAEGVTIVSTVGGGIVTLSRSSGAPGGSISGTAIASRSNAASSGSETSVVLRTTTLPNGGQSTITDLTIVKGSATGVVTPSGTAGVGGGSETTTAAPGLQTNLSPRTRSLGWEVVGALGGAVGFAMML